MSLHVAAAYGIILKKDVILQSPSAPPQPVTVAFKTITKAEPKPVIVPQKAQPKPQPKKITKKPARKKLVKKVKKKIIVKKIVKKTIKKTVQKTPPKKAVSKPAPIKTAALVKTSAPNLPKKISAVTAQKPNIGNKTLRVLSAPKPKYPPSSRRMGQEAIIKVAILVGINGKPKNIEMKQPSRHAKLNVAAMQTARRYRFAPAEKGGQKIEQWVTLPIHFILR